MRWQAMVILSSIFSIFAYLSILFWSVQRRRERESFYRSEIARRMLDRDNEPTAGVVAWIREEELAEAHRRRQSIWLTVCVSVAVGFAALVALGFPRNDDGLFGWLPIGVGAGLAFYLVTFGRTQPAP